MAEQPTFDPRFDPAFQRGYEPPPSAPAVLPAAAPAVPEALAEYINEPPTVETEPEPSEVIATAENLDPVRRGVNPYVVVLWVLGILFAVGGVVFLLVSFTLVYSGSATSPSQAAMLQAIYTFGTVFGVPLSTVGLATIVGLVFFSAWRSWRWSERTPS
jgi:hypothetical protein